MMKKSLNTAQSGFTLIELIIVIVILGILAATALPKFANLGGDARAASLQAAKGALSATSAMVHGKYLIDPSKAADGQTLTVEGVAVTYFRGYPNADDKLQAAAGLTDFKLKQLGNYSFKLIPATIDGTAAEATCYVQYDAPAQLGLQPKIEAVTSTCD